jgi:LmbE family N-acetylglucosaminyl deacetylase
MARPPPSAQAQAIFAVSGPASSPRPRPLLGMAGTTLLDYPDGRLAAVSVATLTAHVHQHLQLARPDALLVFDEGGITGHSDHCQATAAALTAAGRLGLTVIAWAIPDHVAEALNAEFETAFAGRPPEQIDLAITVDRATQLKAIACHASQSADNPVLWRRLELLGGTEHLRYLRRKADRPDPPSHVECVPSGWSGPCDRDVGR